jgi:hypothetical protein
MKIKLVIFVFSILISSCNYNYNEISFEHELENNFRLYFEENIFDNNLNKYIDNGILYALSMYPIKGIHNVLFPEDYIVLSFNAKLESENIINNISIKSCEIIIDELDLIINETLSKDDIIVRTNEKNLNQKYPYEIIFSTKNKIDKIKNNANLKLFENIEKISVNVIFEYELDGSIISKKIVSEFYPRFKKSKISKWDVWMSV